MLQEALRVLPQSMEDAEGRALQEADLGEQDLLPQPFVPVTLGEEPLHCTVLQLLSCPVLQEALRVLPQSMEDAEGRALQEADLGEQDLLPQPFVPVTLGEEPPHCTVLPQLSTPGMQDALLVTPQATVDAAGRSVQEGVRGVVLQAGVTTQRSPEHFPLAHFVPVTVGEEPLHDKPPHEGLGSLQVAVSVVPQAMEDAEGRALHPPFTGEQPPVTQLPPEHVCPAAHAVPVPVQVLVGPAPLHPIAEQVVVTPIRQLSEAVLGIAVPQATEEALAQSGAGYQEAAR